MVYTRRMPWMETHTLDQRRKFLAALASGQWSMTELCARFGVSRPTGYSWLARSRAGGAAALHDRSHAPHHCPHRTAPGLEAQLLAARRQYGWGAKKLLAVLRRRDPRAARSTTCWRGITCCDANPDGAAGTTPASRRSSPPTRIRCGRPISKASSKPATGSTAIR